MALGPIKDSPPKEIDPKDMEPEGTGSTNPGSAFSDQELRKYEQSYSRSYESKNPGSPLKNAHQFSDSFRTLTPSGDNLEPDQIINPIMYKQTSIVDHEDDPVDLKEISTSGFADDEALTPIKKDPGTKNFEEERTPNDNSIRAIKSADYYLFQSKAQNLDYSMEEDLDLAPRPIIPSMSVDLEMLQRNSKLHRRSISSHEPSFSSPRTSFSNEPIGDFSNEVRIPEQEVGETYEQYQKKIEKFQREAIAQRKREEQLRKIENKKADFGRLKPQKKSEKMEQRDTPNGDIQLSAITNIDSISGMKNKKAEGGRLKPKAKMEEIDTPNGDIQLSAICNIDSIPEMQNKKRI